MAENFKVYKIQDDTTGKVYEIEGPADATEDELYSFVEQSMNSQPSAPAQTTPNPTAAPTPSAYEESPVVKQQSLAFKDDPEARSLAQSLWDQGVRDPAKFNQEMNTKFPQYGVNMGPGDIAAMRDRDAWYKARGRKNPGNFVATQETGIAEPQAPANVFSAAGTGVVRSLENMANSVTGLAAVGADLVGADETADSLLQNYVETNQRIGFENPAAVKTAGDVNSVGDAFMYGADILGELVPQITSAMGVGGAGNLVGKKLVGEVAEDQIKKAGMKAATAAVTAQSVGQETGSIFGDTYQETGVKAPISSIAAGLTAGTLEAILPMRALKRFGLDPQIVTDKLVSRMAKEGAKSFLIEGGTEAAQTFIEALPTSVVTGESPFTEKMLDNMVESFIRGGIGGSVVGAGGETLSKTAVPQEADDTPSVTAKLDTYLKTQQLPPKTGEMRKRNASQKAILADATKEANDFVGGVMSGWQNAPEFEVVPSWAAVKDQNLRQALDKDAVGAYGPDGKLYINMKNVEDGAHLTSVVFHEGLGHHGLAQRFGSDLDMLLDQLYNEGVSSFKQKVDAWKTENPDVYADLDMPTQQRRAVEEVLAEMSESGSLPITIRDKVSNFIKEYARRAGMNLKISEREIRSILAEAHNATINGTNRPVDVNGVRYMYAGVKSRKSYDQEENLYDAASHLEENPRSSTRQEFDWFVGPDGNWKREIDDSLAYPRQLDFGLLLELQDDWGPNLENVNRGDMLDNIMDKDFNKATGKTVYQLNQVLSHPELFEAYPQLSDVTIGREADSFHGYYSEGRNHINISPYNDSPMSTLLHEVQHAIQGIEGWPRGGNPDGNLMYKLSPEQVVRGTETNIKFLESLVDKQQKKVEKTQTVLEDPLVKQWRFLEVQFSELQKALDQDYKDIVNQGGNPESDPLYKAVKEEYNDVTEEYVNFDTVFAEAQGWDVNQLSKEQADFMFNIRVNYVYVDGNLKLREEVKQVQKTQQSLEGYQQLLEQLKRSKTDYAYDIRLDALRTKLSQDESLFFEAYQHLFGEVEARDVQARADMDMDDRWEVEPYSSEKFIDPANYIFDHYAPSGRSMSVTNINSRVKSIVDAEAEFWGITNIEKALTERDFRADVRARLAEIGLPQDAINLDPRIQKNIGVKYSMKRRVPRERDERAEISAAKDILDAVLQGYDPVVRTQDEAAADARRAGLTSKQIRSAKGVGELDKRLFMYEKVAEDLNDKLTTLHAKMDNDGFSMATKHKYLQTLAEFTELNAVIFRDQAEVGRALNAIKALQYTKNKITKLNEVLSEMRGNGFSNFADDAAFEAFAEQIKFMLASNNPKGVNALVKSVTKPYWWQYVLSFRHSMMLSGLGTQAKNAADNAIMIARELEESMIALPGFAVRKGLQAAGKNVQDGTSPQEIAARMYGLMRAALDPQTYANTKQAFLTGRGESIYSTKTEMPEARIPGVGYVQDFLHASDIFFRAFHNNANLYTAGVRRARAQGLTGSEAFEEGSNLASTPNAELIEEAKRMTDIALLVDRPSAIANKLEAVKAIRPGMKGGEQATAFVTNLMFPFFRVADRLLFQKLRRAGPLAMLDRVTREDLAAGGSRMDIALGRIGYTSLLLWYYWNAAEEEEITGENMSDYEKQRALEAGGYQSNSVKKNGQYVDASALNLSLLPTDIQNSLAANVATIHRAYRTGASAEDTAEQLKLASAALLKVLVSQSFVQGINDNIEPLTVSKESQLDAAVGNYVGGMASSFVPAIMRQYNAMYGDPIKRDTTGDKSITDRVTGRFISGIPGLSDKLPAKISVYGEEQPQGRSLSGINNYRDIKTEPEIVEMQRLERTTNKAVVRGAPSSFEDGGETFKLNAEQKNQWERLQGKYLRDFVKEMMATPDWAAMSDQEKIEEIKVARKDAYEWTKEDMLPNLTPKPQED